MVRGKKNEPENNQPACQRPVPAMLLTRPVGLAA